MKLSVIRLEGKDPVCALVDRILRGEIGEWRPAGRSLLKPLPPVENKQSGFSLECILNVTCEDGDPEREADGNRCDRRH